MFEALASSSQSAEQSRADPENICIFPVRIPTPCDLRHRFPLERLAERAAAHYCFLAPESAQMALAMHVANAVMRHCKNATR